MAEFDQPGMVTTLRRLIPSQLDRLEANFAVPGTIANAPSRRHKGA